MVSYVDVKIAYLPHYNLEEWGPLVHEQGNACFDLRVCILKPLLLAPGQMQKVKLGIKFDLSDGYCVKVYPRSGLGSKGLTIPNNVGIIDPSYRGEVMSMLLNVGYENISISPGDRILQAEITPFLYADIIQIDEKDLSKTKRGEGGFGHTGVR